MLARISQKFGFRFACIHTSFIAEIECESKKVIPKMRGSLASWNEFCQNAASPHCTNIPVVFNEAELAGRHEYSALSCKKANPK